MEPKTFSDIGEIFAQIKGNLYNFMPRLITALAMLVAGFILARIVRFFIIRFINHSYRLIPTKKIRGRFKNYLEDKPIAKIIGSVVFWFLVFFVLTVTTETLGLPVVTTWLKGIGGYLPKILLAILIIFSGVIGGFIVKDALKTAGTSAGFLYGAALGRLSQIVIVLISLLIAIEQIGIDIDFLTNLLVIIIGLTLFGAVLAFGLGAKSSVNNIIASYYLQKSYHIGDRVKVLNHQGRIIEFTPISVILDATEGRVTVPAKAFEENVSIHLSEG